MIELLEKMFLGIFAGWIAFGMYLWVTHPEWGYTELFTRSLGIGW